MDHHTDESFVDMPFARSVKQIPYETRLARLIAKLSAECLTLTAPGLNLWCGADHVRNEWLTSNHEYWAGILISKCGFVRMVLGTLPFTWECRASRYF